MVCRDGEVAEDKRKGTDTARKPTRPSGTASDLEREYLTGLVGGTAEQPTEDTLKNFITQIFGIDRINSLDAMPARWGTGTSRHMTGRSQLSCVASPTCGLLFSRAMESRSLLEAAFLKILAVEINPL